MDSWLVHHWFGLSGGGLGLLPALRMCQLFQVQHIVLKGDSWPLEYRRREHPEVVL